MFSLGVFANHLSLLAMLNNYLWRRERDCNDNIPFGVLGNNNRGLIRFELAVFYKRAVFFVCQSYLLGRVPLAKVSPTLGKKSVSA
jgi:hypothetical protein